MNTDLLLGGMIAAICLAGVFCYLLFLAVKQILWMREELQVTTDTEHAKCMAAVMKFIGNEWAAQVLDVAADDYENASNHADLDRISRLVYKPGGSPVPSLWLRERAERLRILDDWGTDPVKDAEKINLNEVAL